jgi:hypothetical protein
MELKTGQTVYIKPVGNNARYDQEIKEGVVSKVGKKWFEIENYHRCRFSIETGSHDGGQYISGYQVYSSMQEIEDEQEHNKLWHILRRYFEYYSGNKHSLETLRKINEIIKAGAN